MCRMTTLSAQVEQLERISTVQAEMIRTLRKELEQVGITHLNETTTLEEERDAIQDYSNKQSSEIDALKKNIVNMKNRYRKSISELKKDHELFKVKYDALVSERIEVRSTLGIQCAEDDTLNTLDTLQEFMEDIDNMKNLNTALHDKIYDLNEELDLLKEKLFDSKCLNPYCSDTHHRHVKTPCTVCCREIAETTWEHEGVCCRSCSNQAQRCYVCRLTMYECDNNNSKTWTCMRNIAKRTIPKSVAEA